MRNSNNSHCCLDKLSLSLALLIIDVFPWALLRSTWGRYWMRCSCLQGREVTVCTLGHIYMRGLMYMQICYLQKRQAD